MEQTSKKDTLLIIVFSIIGAAISVFSFWLYHSSSHFLVTTAICMADIAYAYFNARFFFKTKEWNGVRQIFIPLMMIVYWTAVFAIISIGNATLLDGDFSYQFFLYPVFLLPSFVVVLLLLILVGMGL